MGARVKLPGTLGGLLKTQLEQAIYEASLSEADTIIATRYIVEKVPQIDIAAELGCTRATISLNLPRILKAVEQAARALYTK